MDLTQGPMYMHVAVSMVTYSLTHWHLCSSHVLHAGAMIGAVTTLSEKHQKHSTMTFVFCAVFFLLVRSSFIPLWSDKIK